MVITKDVRYNRGGRTFHSPFPERLFWVETRFLQNHLNFKANLSSKVFPSQAASHTLTVFSR